MFDADDVAVEMQDDPVVGHIVSGNQPYGRRGPLDGGGVAEWAFGRHFNERGTEQVEGRRKGCRRPGTIMWLFHEARRPHDLILVAGFALLNAGGENVFGRHVGDRDARASDLSPEHHRAMAYDADEDGRRLWIVQSETGWGFVVSRDCEAREEQESSATEAAAELWQQPDSFHFRAWFDVFKESDEPSDLAVACREDHALRLDAHQLGRLQVSDDDDGFADQGFRLVFLTDARHDLPLLVLPTVT